MRPSRLNNRFARWFWRPKAGASASPAQRKPQRLVVILDGTMSSLEEGYETNAGILYRLCAEAGARNLVFYEPGVQWPDWYATRDVMLGKGMNRQIRRAYGWLASRYRSGDQIYLFGYSRGAFAVRSLAGVIDMVGLLKSQHATHRNVRLAYRHYEDNPFGHAAAAFSQAYCRPKTEIELVGVWDTVKALGLRLPILWKLAPNRHEFHTHTLGPSVKNGFHALALDETRLAYDPIMWTTPPGWKGHVEQVWFTGSHGDIGGQLNGFVDARPRANVPLVWMLERAEACGLALPTDWKRRFVQDVRAPSVGTWRGWAKIMVLRADRPIGRDRSERLHDTVSLDHPAHDKLSVYVSGEMNVSAE